ncbi:MAG: hypothetical protein IJE74_07105 [Clostridia bacterium]|nr:hypothetical protein [Clostridia bacterium]
MFKKFLLFFISLFIILGISACGVENNDKNTSNMISFTSKETLIHNYFKDRIPDFNFKNEVVEKYDDGISYILTVKCDKNEFKKYLKKLKKAGFEENVVEAETYYSANDGDGYFIEATYVGEMLTVYVKMI